MIHLFQPHDHQKKVAKFYYATPDLVTKAIETSLEAKKEWSKVSVEDKMKLFLDVADKVEPTNLDKLNLG
jgi:1-pyrroline-5-carboxylate dehydrogenase